MPLRNKTNLVYAIAFISVIPTTAIADWGYINVRTEYLQTQRVNYDRLMLGYGWNNGINIHTELMWKHKDHKEAHKNNNGATTRPTNRDRWGDFVDNGHGLILNYNYTNADLPGWTLIPTFAVYTSSYWTTYEPGLEAHYKFNSEWRLRSRFRVDFDKPTSTNTSPSQKTYRPEIWVDYGPQNSPWSFTYNFIYYDTEVVRWNGKKYDYAQDFAVKYKIGNWQPALQIADVKGPDKFSDNRQIRWRAGLTYSF
ncbi:oligogalacturonate-specific porin KdgM family protein [Enterobacter hormaechei]|uniref:oligogalacturonate-specific porin KdgM family protein n=1 Tax=Enterobacter hormaechei TaxID=158836 RepID=UPI00396FDB1E|nr:hypothetical protein [Klebsiella quasipneumoniae]EIY5121682.1 hypothetical protein [Klebsiella quasipneumoniae]EIY5465885.1 hypothetical protein [Klebsiella quasipneumoniae]